MPFVECSICSAKPGTPTLYRSCLSNRETIALQEEEIQQLREKIKRLGRFNKRINSRLLTDH